MQFNSDIYDISNLVNDVQKKYMEDVNEETLSMGIYGYMNEIFSKQIQNSIIVASEWGNEAIPTRAKFEKTILTNAINYNVEDINAVPSKMEVMIGFIKNELDDKFIGDRFIIDKNCEFYIEDFEFHLDYDIIITRTKLNDKEYTYSARYMINRNNPVSDIVNPYLQSPIMITVDNSKFIFITCLIRQVEFKTQNKKIISNNILENKTFEFSFSDQLASFDIVVEENGKETYVTPIFEGMAPLDNKIYCFYTYIDANTIRVKFDRNSYEPKLNCNVRIDVKTTRGSGGNFTYKDDIITSLDSTIYNYKNLSVLLRPVTNSMMGIDRKSVKMLKEIIPKELLSRGNIINNKDLENFFNMIDVNNRIFFFRKRDNQFERLYYAYLIIKDEKNNIIPSNTINMKLKEEDFSKIEDNRCILNPGIGIKYKNELGYISNENLNDENAFNYSSPFIVVVNKNPLSVSYYLDTIDRTYNFIYSYINNNSNLQFIANNMNIYKNYLESSDYKININLMQNMNINKNLVKYDNDGNISGYRIKPVIIIENNKYKYYKIGEITDHDLSKYSYNVEFKLETDGVINKKNQIKIKNLYLDNTDQLVDIYLDESTKLSFCIFIENTDNIIDTSNFVSIPELSDYIITNKYDTNEKVNLFYNYSDIVNSTVKVNNEEDNSISFTLKGAPVIKYSYLNNIDRCNELIEYLQFRKAYIDAALKILEDGFNIDLKFFNTYGPSKTFKIGYNYEYIDKVNLSMVFRVKQMSSADKYTKDNIVKAIKEYMENINNIRNIHMSNLTTYIKNKFKSEIEFIEFVNINEYDSNYQYIEREEMEIIEQVPEFLNINLKNNVEPDIDIIIL